MQQHVGNTRDLPVILQACRGYRGAAACAGLASLGAALISVEGVVRNYHNRAFAGVFGSLKDSLLGTASA